MVINIVFVKMEVSGKFHVPAAPVTHWIGGWVGPRAVLDVVVKRKIIFKY